MAFRYQPKERRELGRPKRRWRPNPPWDSQEQALTTKPYSVYDDEDPATDEKKQKKKKCLKKYYATALVYSCEAE